MPPTRDDPTIEKKYSKPSSIDVRSLWNIGNAVNNVDNANITLTKNSSFTLLSILALRLLKPAKNTNSNSVTTTTPSIRAESHLYLPPAKVATTARWMAPSRQLQ